MPQPGAFRSLSLSPLVSLYLLPLRALTNLQSREGKKGNSRKVLVCVHNVHSCANSDSDSCWYSTMNNIMRFGYLYPKGCVLGTPMSNVLQKIFWCFCLLSPHFVKICCYATYVTSFYIKPTINISELLTTVKLANINLCKDVKWAFTTNTTFLKKHNTGSHDFQIQRNSTYIMPSYVALMPKK